VKRAEENRILQDEVGTLRQQDVKRAEENRILRDEVGILQETLNKILAFSASRRDL
jgi:hypothetical protein